MKKTTSNKKIFIASLAVIVALLFGWAPLVQRTLTTDLRKTFSEEFEALRAPLASLGVDDNPRVIFQCTDDVTTHWHTQAQCQNFAAHKYSGKPIGAAARKNYPVAAANLEKLLKSRGWVNDSNQSKLISLPSINPYSPQNGGIGGAMSYQKNTGAVRCDLEIDFDSIKSDGFETTASPGAISINEFSCYKDVKYIQLHRTTYEYQGV